MNLDCLVAALVTNFGAKKPFLHLKIHIALNLFLTKSHWASLKTVSGIDNFITKHGVDAVDWSVFTSDQKMYFLSVQAAMQYLFYTDTCATFYNTKLQAWTTCW